MPKDILFDPALAERIRAGSNAVRRTVERNYGPEGRNTIREQTYDLPLVANTGRRTLQELSVADRGENLAAVLVREAALKVAAECGDGTIAAAVLADSLITEGQKLIAAGFDPMAMRRGIHDALVLIRQHLEEIAVPFGQIGLERFAAAAAKNDEVARIVARAFAKVGADGVITVQDTQGRDTVLRLWDGVRYDYGLFDAAFATDPVKKSAVLTEPYVLLSNVKINSIRELQRLLEELIRSGGSLLIITNDMAEEVRQILALNASRGLKVAVAKAPGFGDTRRRNMLALAAKIGSLLFEEKTGRELKDCGLGICRQIGRAEISGDDTVLQGFRDTSEEMVAILQRHTQRLLEQTADPDEREKLLLTLSILNGQTAEIQVGGVVEYEMFEKKYLYENTVRAVQGAARSGLVPGAGSAYVYLAGKLAADTASWPEDRAAGAACLCRALRSLAASLFDNAGENSAVILARLDGEADPYRGYDVIARRFVDLKASGILTPRNTAETIIRTAAETAASLWTTGAAVLET